MIDEFDCKCQAEFCEMIEGNEVDLELKKSDCEVRADVLVKRKRCVRVWGQVKDCEGRPVKDALVKLLKAHYYHGKLEFEGVAHTVTDCEGFYQFDVCGEDEHAKFRIIVSKATFGNERTIMGKSVCNPCDD